MTFSCCLEAPGVTIDLQKISMQRAIPIQEIQSILCEMGYWNLQAELMASQGLVAYYQENFKLQKKALETLHAQRMNWALAKDEVRELVEGKSKLEAQNRELWARLKENLELEEQLEDAHDAIEKLFEEAENRKDKLESNVKPPIHVEDDKGDGSKRTLVENELVGLEDALQKQADWIAKTERTEKWELQVLIRAALAKVAAAKNALNGIYGNSELEDFKAAVKDPTLERSATSTAMELEESKKEMAELAAKVMSQSTEMEALRRRDAHRAKATTASIALQETSQAAADAADAMDATDADLPFLRDQEVQTDFADKKDALAGSLGDGFATPRTKSLSTASFATSLPSSPGLEATETPAAVAATEAERFAWKDESPEKLRQLLHLEDEADELKSKMEAEWKRTFRQQIEEQQQSLEDELATLKEEIAAARDAETAAQEELAKMQGELKSAKDAEALAEEEVSKLKDEIKNFKNAKAAEATAQEDLSKIQNELKAARDAEDPVQRTAAMCQSKSIFKMLLQMTPDVTVSDVIGAVKDELQSLEVQKRSKFLKELCLVWHPDKTHHCLAKEVFQEIMALRESSR